MTKAASAAGAAYAIALCACVAAHPEGVALASENAGGVAEIAPPLVVTDDQAKPPGMPVSLEGQAPTAQQRMAFDAAMREADERQRVFADAAHAVKLEGIFAQGGLVFGQTVPGAKVRLNGAPIMIGSDGRFVIGFGRDAGATALLVVEGPGAILERRALEIEDREFPVDRIDGLDQSKVSGFTEEQLAKIAIDRQKKSMARAETQDQADWAAGFSWPMTGRISGVFGSQRILNGEPKTPHSGVDIAAPAGTVIRAPAAGIVRLADPDMYFEGGLILLDHGHWLESAFLHMSRLDVKPGDHVEKGQIIGAVGATGRATGPHMHWSIKWAGLLVDPQLVAGAMPAAGENVTGAQN